ncbi:MAG: hypothetical protein MK193_10655 [Lentisphaeria bacterium]|nr:hypothetical protein [Lentisphaeria bacterium]
MNSKFYVQGKNSISVLDAFGGEVEAYEFNGDIVDMDIQYAMKFGNLYEDILAVLIRFKKRYRVIFYKIDEFDGKLKSLRAIEPKLSNKVVGLAFSTHKDSRHYYLNFFETQNFIHQYRIVGNPAYFKVQADRRLFWELKLRKMGEINVNGFINKLIADNISQNFFIIDSFSGVFKVPYSSSGDINKERIIKDEGAFVKRSFKDLSFPFISKQSRVAVLSHQNGISLFKLPNFELIRNFELSKDLQLRNLHPFYFSSGGLFPGGAIVGTPQTGERNPEIYFYSLFTLASKIGIPLIQGDRPCYQRIIVKQIIATNEN